MITAAEKHISGDKGGNLQAEDLTSSLWLIVELTGKSPPTTGLQPTYAPAGRIPCTISTRRITQKGQRNCIWSTFSWLDRPCIPTALQSSSHLSFVHFLQSNLHLICQFKAGAISRVVHTFELNPPSHSMFPMYLLRETPSLHTMRVIHLNDKGDI